MQCLSHIFHSAVWCFGQNKFSNGFNLATDAFTWSFKFMSIWSKWEVTQPSLALSWTDFHTDPANCPCPPDIVIIIIVIIININVLQYHRYDNEYQCQKDMPTHSDYHHPSLLMFCFQRVHLVRRGAHKDFCLFWTKLSVAGGQKSYAF